MFAGKYLMSSSIDSTSTTFQPFFLDFYRVHGLATHFFIRMWSESGAASGDFTRVVALVRSQYVFWLHIFGLANSLNVKESKLLYDEKMFAPGTR
jgi:hypothetical protein